MNKKPLRSATITIALKKAGFRQSKWLASSRVRGWGSHTEGFEVKGEKIINHREYTGRVFVTYQQSTSIVNKYSPAKQERELNKIAIALRDMGYEVSLERYGTNRERLVVERTQ